MKLSEMRTDRAADAMVAIASSVSSIIEDKAFGDVLSSFSGKEITQMTMAEMVSLLSKKLIPLALQKRRGDLYLIVCAMTEKTLDTVKEQSVLDTMRDFKEFIDRDFLDFFKPAVNTGETEA